LAQQERRLRFVGGSFAGDLLALRGPADQGDRGRAAVDQRRDRAQALVNSCGLIESIARRAIASGQCAMSAIPDRLSLHFVLTIDRLLQRLGVHSHSFVMKLQVCRPLRNGTPRSCRQPAVRLPVGSNNTFGIYTLKRGKGTVHRVAYLRPIRKPHDQLRTKTFDQRGFIAGFSGNAAGQKYQGCDCCCVGGCFRLRRAGD